MVAAMLNLSLVLWKTKPIFAQSHNGWLAACSYKQSHGSFITIIWESKTSAEMHQPLPAPRRALARNRSGSALKKTSGAGYRRKARGSRKEVQTNEVSLSTYKVLCCSVMKKPYVNTSSQISLKNIRATLWYEKQIQGENFAHSPGWADKTLRQCLWLYLCSHHGSACSHVLLHPFTHVSPPARIVSLGSCIRVGSGCCSCREGFTPLCALLGLLSGGGQ